MSNEKFTPGEWHRAVNMSRNGKTARGFSPCRIKSAKGIIVAFTVPQKSRQEQIANTNLIAAAPEMYRMLEQLHGVLASVPALQSEIEKVLKKARGE